MLRRKIFKKSKVDPAKEPIDPSTIPEAKRPDPVDPAAAAPEVPGKPAADSSPEPEAVSAAPTGQSDPVIPDSMVAATSPEAVNPPEETPEPAEETVGPDALATGEVPEPVTGPDSPSSAGPAPTPTATFIPEPLPEPTPPPTRSTLPPTSPLAASRIGTMVGGIDLGGTKIAAAVIGPGHEVIAYRRRPTPDTGGPADVVAAMALTMQEAAADANIEAHHLKAVGVGSPGSVDTATGAVTGAGNLPGWDGKFQMGMALREAIGSPVTVGNDVQVGTNAEFQLGAGAGYDNLLGVFWGTGVGGGIILDGVPYKGRGRAGEIGHMVVKRGGAMGLNGLEGTVEAYAGRAAMEAKVIREMKKGRKSDLFKLMEKHGKTHLTSAIWAHALDHNDKLAAEILKRAVKALSAGIASAVNLLDIEAVVIGGGLGVRFADSLVQDIIEGMGPHLLNADNPPDVKIAGLGDEGGVIGAALLVS
ncbi:MAG: ROK family protein [Solirubrobacterales bacterium]